MASWFLALSLAASCGGSGSDRTSTPSTPIGTLAYVVTECREDPSGFFGRQRLDVRLGEAPAVTVMQFPWTGPLPGAGLCELFGISRYGTASVYAGAFQRIGVTPDGSGVLFEVTDEFSINASNRFAPPEREGIYFVRADGSDLRRIGPASRAPSSYLELAPTPTGFSGFDYAFFSFTSDGRRVAFTDLGPGPDGTPAIQIFVQELDGGEPRQLTRLPPSGAVLPTRAPVFVTDDVIGFLSFSDADGSNPSGEPLLWSVAVDGTDLRRVQAFGPGSTLAPLFAITGGGRASAPLVVGDAVEVVSFDGTNLLQLTRFGRVDTGTTTFTSADGSRVFFDASADPRGTNPSHNCQLFSIDALGGDLQQLTFFREVQEAGGCGYVGLPGCSVSGVNRYRSSQDARTGTVVFYTSCEPTGGLSTGGEYYAMRPDGSAIRALTETYGIRYGAGGTISVELPGPAAYGPYQ